MQDCARLRVASVADEATAMYPGFDEDAGRWGLQTSAGYCIHVFAVRATQAECAVTSFSTVSDDLVFVVRAYILVLFPLRAGIGVGVVMGWFKGLKDAEHLSGTYGRGSVYKGTFATFRVPANFVQVGGKCVFMRMQCMCVCMCARALYTHILMRQNTKKRAPVR